MKFLKILEQLEHDRLLAENMEDIRNQRTVRHDQSKIKRSEVNIATLRNELAYPRQEEYSPYDTHLPDLQDNKGK